MITTEQKQEQRDKDDAVRMLKDLFPTEEEALLRSVLEAHEGNQDLAAKALQLTMKGSTSTKTTS